MGGTRHVWADLAIIVDLIDSGRKMPCFSLCPCLVWIDKTTATLVHCAPPKPLVAGTRNASKLPQQIPRHAITDMQLHQRAEKATRVQMLSAKIGMFAEL